jgi:hypothetical protein
VEVALGSEVVVIVAELATGDGSRGRAVCVAVVHPAIPNITSKINNPSE